MKSHGKRGVTSPALTTKQPGKNEAYEALNLWQISRVLFNRTRQEPFRKTYLLRNGSGNHRGLLQGA